MELAFLGSGAGSGVPAFYCNCRVCAEALQDPRCRRTRCGIAILGEENLLFDAPPELSWQLQREQVQRIDRVFITHAHHDHTAGLGDLEIYARFYLRRRLPAIMSLETREELEKQHGPLADWMDITLLQPGQKLETSGASVIAVQVSHASGSLGFLILHEGRRTAYLPDTGPLPESTKTQLVGVDNLVLDCTFWGDNLYPNDHLAFHQTLQLGDELHAGTLYLTHLSMHYSQPVTSREIEESIAPYAGRVRLAYDGLRVALSDRTGEGRSADVPVLARQGQRERRMQ
jgi:phosphoribosyl 1,2-cyclic phosphate phosphodiesterase